MIKINLVPQEVLDKELQKPKHVREVRLDATDEYGQFFQQHDAGSDARSNKRSLRRPRTVPRCAGLLDLHGPGRRQLREHRQLVRRSVRHGQSGRSEPDPR